jgi:membrane associated rhomboid family serine protease
MLEARDYMREPAGSMRPSMTAILTIVLVMVFALQCINDVYLHAPIEYWLGLTPMCFEHGWVWQLITFQFLHAGLWHIACNLIVFWWVGHFVENVLGKQRFLVALFGCGVAGGIVQELLMILFPERYGGLVVGASAGVAGIFAIFALLERNSEVRLYFVLPVRAITLLWAFGIISVFFTLVPTPREMTVAHAAHLGGMLAGVAWVKLGWHRDYVLLPWEGWLDRMRHWSSMRGHRQKTQTIISRAGESSLWHPAANGPDEDLSTDEFVKSEVDPILDKISRRGIHSLTERERQILEKARSRMAKR